MKGVHVCEKMSRLFIVIFFNISFSIAFSSETAKTYCSVNLFHATANTQQMQFMKELSSSEYGVKSSFKSIHCCAKGYRSIQWFKDGRPYPWAADVSTFILYPEEANQTIYSHDLSTVDDGNYTCQLANDSSTESHSVRLYVFDMSSYMDMPRVTHDLPSGYFYRIGDTARLFCEAYVGKIDLPDAVNEVTWSRPGMNVSQLLGNQRVYKKDISRESDQILGSYLIISNVKKSDFGDYVCSISNSDDQQLQLTTTLIETEWSEDRREFNTPWMRVIIVVTLIGLLILSVLFVYQHVMLSLLLFVKKIFCSRNIDDGKNFDVLVCYAEPDTEFIKTALAVPLHEKYNYNVVYKQLSDPNLAETARQSRNLLLLGSPGMCNNMWTPASIYNLIESVSSISNHVVLIPANPLPHGEVMKSDDGRKLQNALKNISVVNFCGNKQSEVQLFWVRLRLALLSGKSDKRHHHRPRRGDQLSMPNLDAQTNPNFLVLTKSSESLEILV